MGLKTGSARRRPGPAALAATATAAAAALGFAAPAQADRGYELVTPPGADPYEVQYRGADPDGSRIYYDVLIQPASPAGARPDGGVPDVFGATRTGSGWVESWLSPYCAGSFSVYEPGAECDGLDGGAMFRGGLGGKVVFASPSPIVEGKPFVSVDDPFFEPTAELYSGNDSTTALLSWTTPPDPSGWGQGIDHAKLAVSADASTASFVSRDVRLPGASGLQAGDHLYVSRDGTLTLASAPLAGASGACGGTCDVWQLPDGRVSDFKQGNLRHLVSDDGERVFFIANRQLDPAATAGTHEAYVLDGDTLRLLSGALTDPNGDGSTHSRLELATPDGSRAFVMTATAGTSITSIRIGGAQGAVWAVDVPSGTSQRLTPAGVAGNLVWASEDGSTALLRSAAAFDGAPAAGEKLYVWREGGGGARYVGPLGSDTLGQLDFTDREVRGTADGSTIVWATNAQLVPEDTNAVVDLYALRGTSTTPELLTPRSGAAATSAVVLNIRDNSSGTGRDSTKSYPAAVTDDGGTVFFATNDGLVPEDTDGGYRDVYAVRDGKYELVTPAGSESYDHRLQFNNADGSVVLFSTTQSITEVDTDGDLMDVYAARTSGAFVDKLPPPSSTGSPPAAAGPGVAAPVPSAPTEAPPAMVEPLPEVPEWPADPGAQGGSGEADGGELTLAGEAIRGGKRRVAFGLEVPSAGEVRVKLRGRVAGKRGSKVRTIARGSQDVARGGEHRVRVRLTRAGRRFVRGHGGDRVAARVVFVPEDGDRVRLRERLSIERPSDRAAARREARDA